MRNKLLLLAVLICISVPVFAQGPRAEISGGYSFLRDRTADMNFHGWLGSTAVNYNKWLGFEGEVGGNYEKTQVLGTDVNLSVHSFAAGPRFTARTGEGLEVTPFAQILVGAAHARASVLGESDSQTHSVLQPGGGIDYWFRHNLGVRLGGDYRHIFATPEDANEFRFHIGIVFGFGRL